MNGLTPITAMLDLLPTPALVELERVLALTLAEPRRPGEERQTELGHLAGLVAEAVRVAAAQARPGEHPIVRVARKHYDETRPPDAPGGRALAERYGSWLSACHAAGGLADEESRVTTGKPWSTPTRERLKPLPYTRAEVLAAIRAAAAALDVGIADLSSSRYYTWVAEQRARARGLGMVPPRLPTQRSVDRLFRRFTRARKAASRPRLPPDGVTR